MMKEIDSLKIKMEDKEDTMYVYFKTISKLVSNYEGWTEDMVTALRSKRDEQVNWCVQSL